MRRISCSSLLPIAALLVRFICPPEAALAQSCEYVGVFDPPIHYQSGIDPHGVVVADFNGDGILDIATANSDWAGNGAAGSVAVTLGQGDGGVGNGAFAAPTNYLVAGQPFSIVSADFNADGIRDLATANYLDGTVSILLGHGAGGLGDGTFEGPVYYPAGSFAYFLLSADFNEDGIPDLAVTNNYSPNASFAVLLGHGSGGVGDGTFNPRTLYFVGSAYPTALAAADFTGDGILDLALTGFGYREILIYRGLGSGGVGNGGFALNGSFSTTGKPFDIETSDFNGDGLPDLAVAGHAWIEGTEIFFGNGAGAFPTSAYYTDAPATVLVMGDFDRDGVPDIAAAGGSGLDRLTLLLGRGDGSFSPIWTEHTLVNSFGLASGDFNGDGLLDLVVARFPASGVDVLLQSCVPRPPRPTPVGDWAANGIPVCTANGEQWNPAIVADGAGGCVVAWEDARDGSAKHVYAQRITAAGVPLWPTEGVPVSASSDRQILPLVAGDRMGGAYVAWQGPTPPYGDYGLFVQHLSAAGTVYPGWPSNGLLVAGLADTPVIAEDDSSGVFLGWSYYGNAISCQRLKPSGAPAAGWPPSGVSVALANGSSNLYYGVYSPAMVTNGRSGLHVAWLNIWTSCHMGSCQDYGTQIGMFGVTPQATQLYNLSALWCGRVPPILCQDGLGGAVLGYGDDALNLVLRRFTSTGAPAWAPFVVFAAGSQYAPAIVPDGIGGGIAGWLDNRQGPADLYGIRIRSNGVVPAPWLLDGTVICNGAGKRDHLKMASDGGGGALLCWEDTRNVDPDVYAVEITAAGATDPKWEVNGLPLCSAPGAQINPVIARADYISMIAAWEDHRDTRPKVYAQRVRYDASVAVTISLESASAELTGVDLSWYVVEDEPHEWTVYRSRDASAWTPIGSAKADGRGHVAFSDATVEPGARYGYRLGTVDLGAARAGGEVWVEVPLRAVFALHGVRPNPVERDVMSVAFELDHFGAASLTVVDVTGRRAKRFDLSAKAPGSHVVAVPTSGLPPGVYWIVLRSGTATARTRAAIVR